LNGGGMVFLTRFLGMFGIMMFRYIFSKIKRLDNDNKTVDHFFGIVYFAV